MVRLLLSSLLAVGLLGGPALAQKEKDAKKDAPKVETKGQTVKVKSVDAATNTLIVTTAEGKALTFKVDRDVNIVGPRGGKSEERLKDDRLKAGSEIVITLGADGKSLKEIKLGFRKKEPEKDKPARDKKEK